MCVALVGEQVQGVGNLVARCGVKNNLNVRTINITYTEYIIYVLWIVAFIFIIFFLIYN